LAKKRRKVLSETYTNFAIAAFGRPVSSMSTIRLKRDRVVKRFDKTQRTQASGD
jgi:hypothetical protein